MAARRGIVLVITLILTAVTVSACGMLLFALVGGPSATVPSSATLFVPIQAPFGEIEPSDVLRPFLAQPPSLRGTVDVIRKAKSDSRVKGLVVRPEAAGALWAQVQEVRAALEDFKTSGKPLTAFLEVGSAQEYYVASVADRIVMMPAGQLQLVGTASYELFFRGALDKLGVYPDLLHIGEYKTYSNTFAERGFTGAHREMTRSMNRDYYDELVRTVAKSRKMTEEAARKAIDGGPYLADGALKAGLVDELAYEDQLDDKAPIQGTQRLDAEQYSRLSPPTPIVGTSGRIALLYAVGTIASGKSSFDSPTGLVLGSETFKQWLEKTRVDPSIRAVVVRIDSPGGSAIASEVMWRELMLTRDVKPVIVSMGNVAASGGYYIAAPAQMIVAEPGTITGSIGVVTGKFVLQGALDKLGVGVGSVSEGRFAEIDSPFKPFSPEERARVEEQMQSTYELFLKRVADGRRVTPAKIDAVAQGRVWTGRQARELGLVDELGGLDDALRLAKQQAKLDPAKGVELVVYPAKRSFYDVLSGALSNSNSGLETALARPGLNLVQSAAATLRLFRPGEPLAIMPNIFVH